MDQTRNNGKDTSIASVTRCTDLMRLEIISQRNKLAGKTIICFDSLISSFNSTHRNPSHFRDAKFVHGIFPQFTQFRCPVKFFADEGVWRQNAPRRPALVCACDPPVKTPICTSIPSEQTVTRDHQQLPSANHIDQCMRLPSSHLF